MLKKADNIFSAVPTKRRKDVAESLLNMTSVILRIVSSSPAVSSSLSKPAASPSSTEQGCIKFQPKWSTDDTHTNKSPERL